MKVPASVAEFLVSATGQMPVRYAGWPVPFSQSTAWAVLPFRADGKAHRWRRGELIDGAIHVFTMCGLGPYWETPRAPLLAEGTWGRCARCVQAVASRKKWGLPA